MFHLSGWWWQSPSAPSTSPPSVPKTMLSPSSASLALSLSHLSVPFSEVSVFFKGQTRGRTWVTSLSLSFPFYKMEWRDLAPGTSACPLGDSVSPFIFLGGGCVSKPPAPPLAQSTDALGIIKFLEALVGGGVAGRYAGLTWSLTSDNQGCNQKSPCPCPLQKEPLFE